jgi:ribonuclease BN (tRNA processing enzyme)
MKVELVPSAVGGGTAAASASVSQYLTSIRINDSICLDAGSIGFHADLEVQRAIRHLFLSHSHIDHIASLPMLLDNVFGEHPEGVCVHAGAETEAALREDIFNDRTWPDFIRISEQGPVRLLDLQRLEAGRPVEIDGVQVTPIPVEHIVPTFGFLVDDGRSAVLIATDTAPCAALREAANAVPHLKAVVLEASFPEKLLWLADASMHLTPRLFAEEIAQFAGDPTFFAVHLKATHRDEIIRELDDAGVGDVVVMEAGHSYEL